MPHPDCGSTKVLSPSHRLYIEDGHNGMWFFMALVLDRVSHSGFGCVHFFFQVKSDHINMSRQ